MKIISLASECTLHCRQFIGPCACSFKKLHPRFGSGLGLPCCTAFILWLCEVLQMQQLLPTWRAWARQDREWSNERPDALRLTSWPLLQSVERFVVHYSYRTIGIIVDELRVAAPVAGERRSLAASGQPQLMPVHVCRSRRTPPTRLSP